MSADVKFRKSSFSPPGVHGPGCVEVAFAGDEVLVRDSKLADSPILRFTKREWVAFLAGVKNAEFET